MSALKIRPSIENYLDVSPKNLELLDNFLELWKRREDIDAEDIIEAKRRYSLMIKEDQATKKHIGDQLSFFMHSWVVGEYASTQQKKINKALNARRFLQGTIDMLVNFKFTPFQTYFGGGSHDFGKIFLKDELQYAHEHIAWTLLMDNGYEDLANLTQPHQPGEKTVLKMLHDKGIFTEVNEKEFCKDNSEISNLDLIMLADMSCSIGSDGARKRMNDIKNRYDPNHPLVVGIKDPELGEERVIAIEDEINELLVD